MSNPSYHEPILFPNDLFPILIHWNDHPLDATKITPEISITWHECFEILFVLEGGIKVYCGYQSFLCHAGDIFIINPCEEHVVLRVTEAPVYHCLMISPRLYAGEALDFCDLKYMMPYNKSRLKVNNLIRNNPRALQILEELLLEYREQQYGYEIMVKGDVLRFLAELFRNELNTLEREEYVISNKANYALIAPVFPYIAEHYSEKITLSELSSLCCVSSAHLCRVFKKLVGKTIFAYLNEYRLSKAKLMLVTSGKSIEKIAVDCGYADERYMMRRFREAYGITPGAYRNLSLTENEAVTRQPRP